MARLREIEVTYDNGLVIPTSMAAHLSNKEIRNYFKVGRIFNVGNVKDAMTRVKRVRILI